MVWADVVEDMGSTSRPLRVGIDQNHEHTSHETTRKVNMDSIQRPIRPQPGMKGSHCRQFLHLLTRQTTLCEGRQLLVQTRPPHVAACYRLHPSNTRMTLMQHVQHRSLALPWHDYMNSPQNTHPFKSHFRLTAMERLQAIWDPIRPTPVDIPVHSTQQGVTFRSRRHHPQGVAVAWGCSGPTQC